MAFLSRLIAAAPQFYLSWTLWSVWRDPLSVDGGSWVKLGVGLMALEFILVHSGVFVAVVLGTPLPGLKKAGSILGLFLLYGAFAAAFSASLGWKLFEIYSVVMLGRMIPIFLKDSQQARNEALGVSALSALLYLLAASASVADIWPSWGLTPEVLAQHYPNRGSGLWQQEPQRAIGAACAYFFMIGLFSLLLSGTNLAMKTPQKSRALEKEMREIMNSSLPITEKFRRLKAVGEKYRNLPE